MLRGALAAAMAVWLVHGSALAAPDGAQVFPLRLSDDAGVTTLVVQLSQVSPYKLFTLGSPDRVVLDLLRAEVPAASLPLPGGIGGVRQVRAANRLDGSVRIVLDLVRPLAPVGTMTRLTQGDGVALTIRLTAPPAPTPASLPVPAEPTTPAGATVPPDPRPGGRPVVIAIDAGHGGKDPGAHGPRGVREKDVTLRLSRQLAELVNAEPGMRAVLIRDRDEFVPLRQRMERARAARADLFISIHADAVHNRKVRGASVYVLNEKGATDEASRRLAARENAADLIGGVSLRSKDRVLASVLLDLSQGAALSSSIDVAGDIITAMARVGTVRKAQVMQAPFMVLKSPDVPSVLIETAYISNPEEERRLDSNDYRERLARAILAGTRSYFYRNPPEGSLVASLAARPMADAIRHVVERGDSLSTLATRCGTSVQQIRSANGLRGDGLQAGRVLRIPLLRET